jgi:hypothetical protein
MARWFSPIARFRPLFDPPLSVDAAYEFPAKVVAGSLPLASAGRTGSRYILSVEMLSSTRLRITSATAPNFGSVVSADTNAIEGAPNHLRLSYWPEQHSVTVLWNGVLILRHEIRYLVTAPAQVAVGEDRAEPVPTPSQFPGRVSGVVINGMRIEQRTQMLPGL